jgi:hypothetical protein
MRDFDWKDIRPEQVVEAFLKVGAELLRIR